MLNLGCDVHTLPLLRDPTTERSVIARHRECTFTADNRDSPIWLVFSRSSVGCLMATKALLFTSAAESRGTTCSVLTSRGCRTPVYMRQDYQAVGGCCALAIPRPSRPG